MGRMSGSAGAGGWGGAAGVTGEMGGRWWHAFGTGGLEGEPSLMQGQSGWAFAGGDVIEEGGGLLMFFYPFTMIPYVFTFLPFLGHTFLDSALLRSEFYAAGFRVLRSMYALPRLPLDHPGSYSVSYLKFTLHAGLIPGPGSGSGLALPSPHDH